MSTENGSCSIFDMKSTMSFLPFIFVVASGCTSVVSGNVEAIETIAPDEFDSMFQQTDQSDPVRKKPIDGMFFVDAEPVKRDLVALSISPECNSQILGDCEG